MATLGVAIAVIGLRFAFVGNRDLSKDELMSWFEGLMMLWLEVKRKGISRLCT